MVKEQLPIQKLKDEGTYQSYLEKAASLTEVEE
ncbi:ABC transporter substrate-binding lipoprotein [Streptococcus pneumoniae]|nr:ABC transporter substrate-binding lipoprotein [Streptococcus pneumoniae]